jgi:hypothetical protein
LLLFVGANLLLILQSSSALFKRLHFPISLLTLLASASFYQSNYGTMASRPVVRAKTESACPFT